MIVEDRTSASVVADSTWDGVRLTTMHIVMPRIILAELNTHRQFSRNSASSRAIPTKKQVAQVRESPFVPTRWPRNQSGMVPFEFFEEDTWHYEAQWLKAARQAADVAEEMANDGVHKAIASRILEPFLWHSVIVSSTEWGNFFQQRDHPDAQWEMQTLAKAMRKALDESTPEETAMHVPWALYSNAWTIDEQEREMVRAVAHCARVSYGRELEEKSYEEDAALVERLLKAGHASPFEHVGIVRDMHPFVPQRVFPPSIECAKCPRDEAFHEAYGATGTLGNFDWPWSQLRHHVKEYLPTIAARLDSEHST